MTEEPIITLRRGALYFSRETYERYFGGLGSLVLLRDGAGLIVLPVRQPGAGGYVIKQRNGAGDRVVAAQDFFRENGIDDSVELSLPVRWSETCAGLVSPQVFD